MKRLLAFLVVILAFICVGITVFAVPPSTINVPLISETNKAGGALIGALQTIATIVAISTLLFVGIKFMMAAPSEKADLKGALIPYIVGAILIFAAIPVVQLVQKLSSGIGA